MNDKHLLKCLLEAAKGILPYAELGVKFCNDMVSIRMYIVPEEENGNPDKELKLLQDAIKSAEEAVNNG